MKKNLLLALMLIVALSAYAEKVEIDGICYDLVSKTKEATVKSSRDYSGYSGDIVIPETVMYEGITYKVKSIGEGAFYNCSDLISVTIPNSVISIEKDAFYGCKKLNAVHISDLESWCKIEFKDPFEYAHHLYLNGEEIKDLVIPSSVTSIESYAFQYCSYLTSVTIPNSVTDIGDYSFFFCNKITSITIPNSVTCIGDGAFWFCSRLSSVTIPNSVTSIGMAAFENCNDLTSVTIPNSVTSIGYYTFEYCRSLTSVTISNSVTSIEKEAFAYCESLESVIIPNNVRNIGENAFYNCSNLKSIFIGEGAILIEANAFAKCTELLNVYCMVEETSSSKKYYIGPLYTSSSAFSDSYIEYATLHVPASSLEAYKSTLPWSGFGNIVAIDSVPDDNPTISGSCGESANYSYNKENHTLTISGSGDMANFYLDEEYAPWFSYAGEIKNVEIEPGITSIGSFDFYKCSSITSLAIPPSVKSIGSSAFEDCTSLTSLTLNEGLEMIGGSAFEGCTGLKTLTIPSTVKSILLNAIRNCTNLTEVYCLAESVPDTDDNAFDGTPTEKSTLHVPANAVEKYKSTWPWSDFKEIVALDADGIAKVIYEEGANTDSDARIYDLQGNLQTNMRKGVNIIRLSDGKIRKVLLR